MRKSMAWMVMVAMLLVGGDGHAATPTVRLSPPSLPAAGADAGLPLRIAVALPAAVRSDRAGIWERTDDGASHWSVTIAAAGARTLSARLQGLAPGGRLRLAGADGAWQGPYTVPVTGDDLWTPQVLGDRLVIDWRPPAGASPTPVEVIELYYGYDDASVPKSGACEVDVACPAGAAWHDEARAVARLLIGGQFLCTGTLVNDSARDAKPLLLTAQHCVPDAAHAASAVVYWNYQTSQCGAAPDGRMDHTQLGATFLAADAAADVALVRLLTVPMAAFDVYFAGWRRGAMPPQAAIALHHPAGQEKRISVGATPLRITSRLGEESPGDGRFLQVRAWASGATEPGSSGAGLWDEDHRLVGVLSAGTSGCGASQPDWFGRIDAAWSALAPHLDPSGGGAVGVAGMNPDGSSGSFERPPPPPSSGGGAGGGGGGGGAFSWTLLCGLLAARLAAAVGRLVFRP